MLSHSPVWDFHAPTWDFHAPAWATNMSPYLVYFKAHPRGFDGGYKWDLGRHKNGAFWMGEGEEKGNWSAGLEMV